METKKESKKENKKGFWASLFSPKPCSCSCGGNLIIEEAGQPATACCEDRQATDKPVVKDIKVFFSGCCLQWRSALQAACSISEC